MSNKEERIRQEVRRRYGAAITTGTSCCGTSRQSSCCGSTKEGEAISFPEGRIAATAGYRPEELRTLPAEAVVNSFGCGNPLAFAGVLPGEVVVDIGSGAGIDCFLAAQKVGPTGRVIGIDMTPAMIQKAQQNAVRAGTMNVEFRLGEAESMPLENETADWIISNCVINLSPNKPTVFREAFRALRPGGKLSVSDIMVEELPWILRRSATLYTSCVAGAIPERKYLAGLKEAGFVDVEVTDRLVYDQDQVLSLIQTSALFGRMGRWLIGPVTALVNHKVVGKIWSAKIVARKPLPM